MSGGSRFVIRLRLLVRILLLAVAVGCIYFGGAGAAFVYHQRSQFDKTHLLSLPPLVGIDSTSRVMVFAPHCDDETLGCSGLMQRVHQRGGAVRVVFITNGDGFRAAVEQHTRKLLVGPHDFIDFAGMRQEEALRVLSGIGLTRNDVTFLGYPDQGLATMWSTNWSESEPFTSRYTKCNRSPYPITYDPSANYSGQDAVANIADVIRKFRPTLITVTHPEEDHPDHVYAAAFVELALTQLQADPTTRSWAGKIRLLHYLVHRGDWPLPQGYRPLESLSPPTEMTRIGTQWYGLALTENEISGKWRSIRGYSSQTALMNRFLLSFVRSGEIFGEIRPAELPETTTVAGWRGRKPLLLDPAGDNVLRDLQGGGDITSLDMRRSDDNLLVRLTMRKPVNRRMSYRFSARLFDRNGGTSPDAQQFTFRLNDADVARSDGVKISWAGRHIDASIPYSLLCSTVPDGQPVLMGVSAQTSVAGIEIDKTGVRFTRITPSPRSPKS